MTFIWKKGFGELQEKVKSQNKTRNGKMNQKDLSLFANSPKKIRMVILIKPLIFVWTKAAGGAFLWYSLKKIFLNPGIFEEKC